MGDFGKKLVGGLCVVAAVIGLKVHDKNQDAAEVKAKLIEICEGESECIQDVEIHFDGCFNSAYDMGGRRESASLDGDELASCLNERSGIDWFAYDPD